MVSSEDEDGDSARSADLAGNETEDVGKGLNCLPLADNCRHYEHISEVPWDIHK